MHPLKVAQEAPSPRAKLGSAVIKATKRPRANQDPRLLGEMDRLLQFMVVNQDLAQKWPDKIVVLA